MEPTRQGNSHHPGTYARGRPMFLPADRNHKTIPHLLTVWLNQARNTSPHGYRKPDRAETLQTPMFQEIIRTRIIPETTGFQPRPAITTTPGIIHHLPIPAGSATHLHVHSHHLHVLVVAVIQPRHVPAEGITQHPQGPVAEVQAAVAAAAEEENNFHSLKFIHLVSNP